MPEGFTFEATFDGIRIDVLSSQVSHGRAVVPHRFPKRDGADLEDMGREPFVCTMEFLFIDNRDALAAAKNRGLTGGGADTGNWQDRFTEFDAIVGEDTPRVLIHPYVGAVNCRISNFSHSADGETQPSIRASATFTEEISLPPVFAAGGGAQTRASSQEVRASQVGADNALEDVGLSSDLPQEATAEAEAWEADPELSAREVQLQMATKNNELSAELDALGVAFDLDMHPIMRSYTELQYNLRRSADAFTATTTRIVIITVTEPTPLRVIAARFYGAEQAERRFGELLDLNPEIRDPSLVPSGTTLQAYSRRVASGRLVA